MEFLGSPRLQMGRGEAPFRPNPPTWTLIFIIQGGGRLLLPAKKLALGPGDAVLVKPTRRFRHLVESGRESTIWARFTPWVEWHSFLAWPQAVEGYPRTAVRQAALRRDIARKLFEGLKILNDGDGREELLAMNALEAALIRCGIAADREALPQKDPRVEKAIRLILGNLDEFTPFADHLRFIGRRCNVSPDRLRHLFREEVGLPPGRYRERERMRRAVQLLATTPMRVSEVGYALGYRSAYYFSTRFKAFAGISPAAFRAEGGGSRRKRPGHPPNLS